MPGFGGSMRIAAESWLRRPPSFTIEVRELVVILLFVHLTANAELLARALGPRGMAVALTGFALLMYTGAVRGEQFAVRRALGWIGAPRRLWMGAALAGCTLGVVVTGVTIAFGHSIHVAEPIHNMVLAVTLGPIVEEVCLRGVLVPLLARRIGSTAAVLVTSAVFTLSHWPASLLKLTSIGATGVAYGYIRVRSGSATLAAVAHATYNLTVLVFAWW